MHKTGMSVRCVLWCALLLALLLSAAFPATAEETDVLADSLPMLVNKDHPVAEDFVPANLVLLTEVLDASLVNVKNKDTMAVRAAAEALEVMLEAAKADGIKNWQINTAYRSIADQKKLLDNRIRQYMKNNPDMSRSRARARALRTVAEPGCSEHQLGLAIDINVPGASSFSGTRQCRWLHAHCWEYGFIVRYTEEKKAITGFEAEAWHIRYVGRDHAVRIRDLGLCLEEYLEGIAEGTITLPDGPEGTGTPEAPAEIEEIFPGDETP